MVLEQNIPNTYLMPRRKDTMAPDGQELPKLVAFDLDATLW